MKEAISRTTIVHGLDSEITIFRDEWGVPHAKATTTHGAFFAQGYAHAQDRLWQMDAARRQMAGRWAEWAGPSAVPADTLARRLQVSAASRRDYAAVTEETREMLAAYSAGVNAAIAEMERLPLEYRLLGAAPEPWEPWHCLQAMRQRGYLMGSLWFKLWRAAALGRIPVTEIAKLRYDDDGGDRLAIPPGTDSGRWIATLQDPAPAIEALAGLGATDATGGGSNNWALAPERTASGRPLLAGDPHRALEMPAMYAQMHIACPEFDAIGLSVPGVPGFPHFGHNGSVAWCVTHAFADIHDLFVEEFSPGKPLRHRAADGWREARTSSERIQVCGGEAVEIEIVTTDHGPVIAGDPARGYALSLRSMQFAETDLSFDCLLPMLRAADGRELDEASRGWGLIDHNVLTADTGGHIRHLVRAVVPRRPRLNGWLPVPGWTGEYDWRGIVPFESMPRAADPQRGYLATANNRFIGSEDGEEYFLTDCHPPYRARRIEDRLSELTRASIADMADMHSDDLSLTAPVFQTALAAWMAAHGTAAETSTAATALAGLIVDWDARMTPGSRAAAAYSAFRWSLARILADRSGLAAVVDSPLAKPPLAIDPVTQLWWTLPRLMRDGDTGLLGGADWDDAIAEALTSTAAVFDGRPWADHHAAGLAHPLAAQFPGMRSLLSPEGAPLGGDNDTVWANGCTSATELEGKAAYGAVARYVIDVGDWDNSRWIVASGSSGLPDDPHYLDQHEAWARCELVPMRYDWTIIERYAAVQRLVPAESE